MDTVSSIGRLLLSLAFVLGLMWLIARKAKKKTGGKSSRLVDVLGRQQLSRTASVAVVRVMDQALILGVTDGAVSVIGETDLAAVEARLEEQAPKRIVKATRAPRPARSARPAPPARPTPARPAPVLSKDAAEALESLPVKRSPLAGSALSPDTWRQTIDSLRDLTARTR
ncbi:MAG TPA: flagellar biosynthetic protein FliO [Jatrophihabitans sp.]|jgi:flagellar protein FliO/FliZ|uniref:FliO/MopB family protein n=1 Tax=Jatrophihabitans sp. TaxID=1932789 RepID=UPI002E023D24|nr:flagellar biosynthetic protein FliO [Jatrophihabitans sp.]